MALTTVAELRTALGVGSLYADATLQEVVDAADNVLLPFIWNNKSFNIAHSSTATTGTLYFDHPVKETFYVGQTVVVTGNESHLNGSKTITGVSNNSITFTINNGTVQPYHVVNPYGTVAAAETLDPATIPAIQEAALMVSIVKLLTRSPSGPFQLDHRPAKPIGRPSTRLIRAGTALPERQSGSKKEVAGTMQC